jgi:phosphohistidine phosphatase
MLDLAAGRWQFAAMPLLHLVRHAKSNRDDPSLDDHDRPLAGRGRKAAPVMARWMAENGILPDLVLVSTARRCRETWEAMQPAFRPHPDVAFEAGLYLASSEELTQRLRELSDDRHEVMLIGHNPGLQDLALKLGDAGGMEQASLAAKFPTAALCSLDTGEKPWRRLGQGRLRMIRFIRPSDVEDG